MRHDEKYKKQTMDFIITPLNFIPPITQPRPRPTKQRPRYNSTDILEERRFLYRMKQQQSTDTTLRQLYRYSYPQRLNYFIRFFLIMVGLSSFVPKKVLTFRLILPTMKSQANRYITVSKIHKISATSRYSRVMRRHLSEAVPNDSPTTLDVDNHVPLPKEPSSQPPMSYQLIQDIAASTKIEAREKRKKLLRVAKAIDRGLPNVTTYNPCVILPSTPSANTTNNDNNDDIVTSSTRSMVSYVSKSGLPNRSKLFTVLGIESSCDDTGVAIVRSDGVILGEALVKQNEIHEQWGGVVPGLARDAHLQVIDSVVETALRNANLTSIQNDIDAIAVTVGPGLEICLRVGCQKAISLAQQYEKPFVGVHHLEAHILMARIPTQSQSASNVSTSCDLVRYPATLDIHEHLRSVAFPFLAMLVSGGHCQLIKCIGIGQYEILGGTLDDSLGEAYDKVARLLGLPVGGGGGPAVERLAKKGNPKAIPFTLPMQTSNTLDFSYAGLKTNVRRTCEDMVRKHNEEMQNSSKTSIDGVEGTTDMTSTTKSATLIQSPDQLPEKVKADIAASFQHIAIRHVEEKLKRAMTAWEKQFDAPNCNDQRSFGTAAGGDNNEGNVEEQPIPQYTLALVGGVAANQELRTRIEALCQKRSKPWKMLVPPPRLCTDQGAMSAWAGIERLMVGSSDDRTSDKVYARYPFAATQPTESVSLKLEETKQNV